MRVSVRVFVIVPRCRAYGMVGGGGGVHVDVYIYTYKEVTAFETSDVSGEPSYCLARS